MELNDVTHCLALGTEPPTISLDHLQTPGPSKYNWTADQDGGEFADVIDAVIEDEIGGDGVPGKPRPQAGGGMPALAGAGARAHPAIAMGNGGGGAQWGIGPAGGAAGTAGAPRPAVARETLI
jgi:hypothetical protein